MLITASKNAHIYQAIHCSLNLKKIKRPLAIPTADAQASI